MSKFLLVVVLASMAVVSATLPSWSQVAAQSHNTCSMIEQAGGIAKVQQEAFDAVKDHLEANSTFGGDVNIGSKLIPIWVRVKATVSNPRSFVLDCSDSKVSLRFDVKVTISGNLGSDTHEGSGRVEGHYTVSVNLDHGKVTVCVGDVKVTDLNLEGVQNDIDSWLKGKVQKVISGFCKDIPVLFIDHLSPPAGPPLSPVNVFGFGFRQGSNTFPITLGSEVLLDGNSIATNYVSTTQLRFVLPNLPCGLHNVQVRNPSGIRLPPSLGKLQPQAQLSNTVQFTITQPCQSSGSSPGFAPGNQPPTASFDFSPSSPMMGQVVQFTDQSTDPDGGADIVAWLWEFSDGMTSTEQNHTHTFNNAGTFTVKLTITDSAGQKNTMNKSITVGTAGQLPQPPSGGTPSLKSFDINGNNVIDDPEFFAVVDAWVADQLEDSLFFQAIDLWISQGSITSTSHRSRPFKIYAIALAPSSAPRIVTFSVHGQGIASLRVEVFSLNGVRLFAQEAGGTQLMWSLRTEEGQPIANGTYLYRVTARDVQGKLWKSEVRKLILLR